MMVKSGWTKTLETDLVTLAAFITWPLLDRVWVNHLHGLILDGEGDPFAGLVGDTY